MTDITAFPTIRNPVRQLSGTETFTALAAVKPGQVVTGNATGVDYQVEKCVAASLVTRPIGVAIGAAGAGEKVAVALPGSICELANADDTTGIDAWDDVITNDNAVGGTVSAVSYGSTATQVIVGIALEDIAGGATGRVYILPQILRTV